MKCKTIQCSYQAIGEHDFCYACQHLSAYLNITPAVLLPVEVPVKPTQTLSEKYPQYYKSVGNLTEVDVYAIHYLFDIQDPSGAIQHASKKLLLSGVRTGGKSAHKDIQEARDTLNRWLQLNLETA